jgi:hypothetical protein
MRWRRRWRANRVRSHRRWRCRMMQSCFRSSRRWVVDDLAHGLWCVVVDAGIVCSRGRRLRSGRYMLLPRCWSCVSWCLRRLGIFSCVMLLWRIGSAWRLAPAATPSISCQRTIMLLDYDRAGSRSIGSIWAMWIRIALSASAMAAEAVS